MKPQLMRDMLYKDADSYNKPRHPIRTLKEINKIIEAEKLEFGKQCFEAGREFNSKDGVVDIDVVIFYKGADNSDLTPKYVNFEDYLNEKL